MIVQGEKIDGVWPNLIIILSVPVTTLGSNTMLGQVVNDTTDDRLGYFGKHGNHLIGSPNDFFSFYEALHRGVGFL